MELYYIYYHRFFEHREFCSEENLIIKLVFYLPREWSHRDDNRATRNFFVHIDSISGKKRMEKKGLDQRGILSRHRILFFSNKESVVSLSRFKYASLFSFVGRVSNLWTNHNWKRTFINRRVVCLLVRKSLKEEGNVNQQGKRITFSSGENVQCSGIFLLCVSS